MGIYIKGMEMPQYCGACYVGFCKQIGCELYIGFDDYATSRHPDCPISNIPTPHGRLIDADFIGKILKREVEDELNKNTSPLSWSYVYECLMNDLNIMPTVIEAEEGK